MNVEPTKLTSVVNAFATTDMPFGKMFVGSAPVVPNLLATGQAAFALMISLLTPRKTDVTVDVTFPKAG